MKLDNFNVLNLLRGSASKSNCWQYLNRVIKGNCIEFEIEKIVFVIKVLSLLIGAASKSNFWQYFNCVVKGNLIDFEIGKKVFSIKVLNLLIYIFPNNKYHPNNKNYLRCLLFGERGV